MTLFVACRKTPRSGCNCRPGTGGRGRTMMRHTRRGGGWFDGDVRFPDSLLGAAGWLSTGTSHPPCIGASRKAADLRFGGFGAGGDNRLDRSTPVLVSVGAIPGHSGCIGACQAGVSPRNLFLGFGTLSSDQRRLLQLLSTLPFSSFNGPLLQPFRARCLPFGGIFVLDLIPSYQFVTGLLRALLAAIPIAAVTPWV